MCAKLQKLFNTPHILEEKDVYIEICCRIGLRFYQLFSNIAILKFVASINLWRFDILMPQATCKR